jgi:toxin CcdB
MARFDLYRLTRGRGAYVVDVQSSHLDYLESRAVIPLRKRADILPVADLHPEVDIDNTRYVLATHALASVARRELGRPIGTLAAHRDAITRALDVLLVGF